MLPEGEKLFVYGTLRRGKALHRHIKDAGLEFLAEGRILGRLYDLGEYPGAVPSYSDGEEIQGEVYLIDKPAEQLAALDELEECNVEPPELSLFVRRLADVRLSTGQVIRAWTYFLPREPLKAERICEGDYSRRKPRPQAG